MSKLFRTSKGAIKKYKILFRKEKRKERELIRDLYILTILYLLKERQEKEDDERKKLIFESKIEKIINNHEESQEIKLEYEDFYKLNLCVYLRNPTINAEEKKFDGDCPLRGHFKTRKCNGPVYNMSKCKNYLKMENRNKDNFSSLKYY
ncbi:MAG: hypothetical protein WC584_03790 [Candidatus Pacearchaeota archaeon]